MFLWLFYMEPLCSPEVANEIVTQVCSLVSGFISYGARRCNKNKRISSTSDVDIQIQLLGL